MEIIWGIILIVFTLLLCWLGQTVVTLFPKTAASLQLIEAESEVDPAFYADARGEAVWDMLILWTLPAAGILLILDNQLWAYFGLVGGGSYLYFAGRGITARLAMRRRNIRIGAPGNLKLVFTVLVIWGLIALITIVMAVMAMPLP